MKTYWLTPTGAQWLGKPSAPGYYGFTIELSDIFDGSDERGISTLDLYLHGYSWKTINRLTKAGLVTDNFRKSMYSERGGD